MRIKFFIMSMLLLYTSESISIAIYGELQEMDETSSVGLIEYKPRHYYTESKSYVNGGVTFTYPVGLFITTPIVTITIESGGLFSFARQLAAEITSNSATSTTVRVVSQTLVDITELLTGDADIHIWAVG